MLFAKLHQNMIVSAINEVLYLGSYFSLDFAAWECWVLSIAEVVTPWRYRWLMIIGKSIANHKLSLLAVY